MRDINRIDEFCDRLKVVWRNVPDWRFGQLMMNMFGDMCSQGKDPFFPEDDKMIEFFENYIKREK